ncbi:MAG: energy transducer TonB [Myxococcota bacterium]
MNRHGVALLVGVVITVALFMVVAAFRQRRPPPRVLEPLVTAPLIMSEREPAKAVPRDVFAFDDEVRGSPSESLPPVRAQPSALPGLEIRYSPSRVLAALPGLGELPGGVGAGRGEGSDYDRPPQVLERRPPRYPSDARRRKIEGYVAVRFRVDEEGHVVDLEVIDSDPPGVFDAEALNTARRFRFAPALRNGEPVATTLQQRMIFKLQ